MSEWIKKTSKLSLELSLKGAITIFPTALAALTFFFFFHAASKIRWGAGEKKKKKDQNYFKYYVSIVGFEKNTEEAVQIRRD